MPKDETWIDQCISETKTTHPLVTEAVRSRLKKLLRDQLCSHQLSPVALAELAKLLIADMSAPPPLEEEESLED
jgi:hypothetical protein